MEEILLHNSFILFEIICVIAVFAIFIIRSNYFTEILEHRPRIITQILFMVFYGLLSIIGTVTGIGLFGSIGNVRDIGPMMAGLTCGPVIGLGAGIIGGVYRFLQGGPYMYTGLSAPILCGILGGVLYLANNREFVPTWMATLYMALCDTLISIISRFNASCGVSPASIFPPGNSQPSLNSPYPRCVANIIGSPLSLTSFITAATTLTVFI